MRTMTWLGNYRQGAPHRVLVCGLMLVDVSSADQHRQHAVVGVDVVRGLALAGPLAPAPNGVAIASANVTEAKDLRHDTRCGCPASTPSEAAARRSATRRGPRRRERACPAPRRRGAAPGSCGGGR